MPSKNFCNKCYIPLQFSITFRWSDKGKKKFTENLWSSKVSGVLAKITNLCRGPFLEVLIHKINATKLISIYRWEIQSTVQTIDSDWSVNVVFDLCFFFLILRVRSYRVFFHIQTISGTTRCIRIERIKVTMQLWSVEVYKVYQQINPPDIKDWWSSKNLRVNIVRKSPCR